jgi:hypothetical protein
MRAKAECRSERRMAGCIQGDCFWIARPGGSRPDFGKGFSRHPEIRFPDENSIKINLRRKGFFCSRRTFIPGTKENHASVFGRGLLSFLPPTSWESCTRWNGFWEKNVFFCWQKRSFIEHYTQDVRIWRLLFVSPLRWGDQFSGRVHWIEKIFIPFGWWEKLTEKVSRAKEN